MIELKWRRDGEEEGDEEQEEEEEKVLEVKAECEEKEGQRVA